MNIPDPLKIIHFFYGGCENEALRRMLLTHSEQVRAKASAIGERSGVSFDKQTVMNGAMLHDIGILHCHAPSILCTGSQPYIVHGVVGARMLREYGLMNGIDLEIYARICERHTGSGITAAEVRAQSLPIPERDYLPETPEEKLICLADKFFSKSGDMREKPLAKIRHSLSGFGAESVKRFGDMCRLFGVPEE